MTPETLSLNCGDGFTLRLLNVADVTGPFIAWFNSDYVKSGLNISGRAFTLFDHLNHIEQCRAAGFLLLIVADAQNIGQNTYLKVRIDPQHKVADFDIAMDRHLEQRATILANASRVLMRHLFTKHKIAKVRLRINRSNAAARLYADQSRFQLEGVLRSEVIGAKGKREDVLLYALFAQNLPPL